MAREKTPQRHSAPLRFIKQPPKPFPSKGGSPQEQSQKSKQFKEESGTFHDIFNELKTLHSRFVKKLSLHIEDAQMWAEEIDLTPKSDDKGTPRGLFRKAVGAAESTIREMNNLAKYALSPYFGRIDFTFSNDTPSRFCGKTIRFYIGKQGIQLEKHKITDWRAPISSVYYNFPTPTKECFYKSDEGIITGEMVLKRKIEIEDARLLHVFDSTEVSSLVGSDPFLLNQLKKSSSTRLKDIISTIQAEQNTIISMEPETDIIVQGVAGCGKTSIAVHRLSWLLYNYKSIEPHRCLIIAPTKLFLHYISEILPEIGSENVPQKTFDDWVQGKLRDIIRDEEILPDDPKRTQKSSISYLQRLEKVAAEHRRQKRAQLTPAQLVSIYKQKTSTRHLSTSDLPALLYLKYLLKPPLPHEKIQYLVVDEAQDCSPAQLFILRKYTESGRMMIVGDLMQGIINPDGVSNWDDMIGTIFPQKDTRFFNIRTSYRTTKEIIEFVNSRMRRWHVPSNLLPLPVLRRGIEPHVHHEYDIDEMLMHMGQVIGNMKESGYHNIAVIVPEQFLPLFSAQLDRQYPDMTAVVSTEDTYEGGILISHIKLLKGLEFDAVVYVNYPNEDPGNSMQEIKSFYTSCTRAMHELRIFEYE